MGYTEVSVVVDGADNGTETFRWTKKGYTEMETFIEKTKAEGLADASVVTEIYVMDHGHSLDDGECVCAQYLTDHNPEWTSEAEVG